MTIGGNRTMRPLCLSPSRLSKLRFDDRAIRMTPRLFLFSLLIGLAACTVPALAQDKGTVNPKPLPPLANPNDPKLGAKELFARKYLPAAVDKPRVIGFYAKGCIAGA